MLEPHRSRRPRVSLSRTAHQTKAERSNKREGELLRHRMRVLDGEFHRYSDCVYKEKRLVSRQLEETRQTSGHCPLAVMPESERDMRMISKTQWFKDNQGRLSEKQLLKWRTTESELSRIYNVATDRKEELSQREKNRRLALVHFLRTAGLLDKKTKRVLLPFTNKLSSNLSSDSEEDETDEEDKNLEGVDRVRAHYPRVFEYCKEEARLRSAPSGWPSMESHRRTLENQFAKLQINRRAATANAPKGKRTFIAKQQRPQIRGRPTRGRQVAFAGSTLDKTEEGQEKEQNWQDFDIKAGEIEDQELDEVEDDTFDAFSHLPQWKRDLLMEAPVFIHSNATENSPENVKAIMSKSQIRRDLEEMQNENTKRSRLIHACNLKKVYLQ